jgi:hydroxyacylglutathione hydrolase
VISKKMKEFKDLIILGDYRVLRFKTGRWHENTYLVHHNPSASILVVDPGGEEDIIMEAIAQEQGSPALIILTHAHHDHVGAVKRLCDEYNLPFYIHSGEIKLLKKVPLYAATFEKRVMEVPESYRFLDQEKMEWAGDTIQYLHTPGHTKGGVCYFWKGMAFTGDTLLARQVGRTDLPGAKPDILFGSITNLLERLSDDTILFPGHGDQWSVKDAREWWELHSDDPEEYRDEVNVL